MVWLGMEQYHYLAVPLHFATTSARIWRIEIILGERAVRDAQKLLRQLQEKFNPLLWQEIEEYVGRDYFDTDLCII